MRNILLRLSYDGTDFCGWQKQIERKSDNTVVSTARTIQEEVEKVLLKIHKEVVPLYGSGRTDSGVHAQAQAANFYSPIDSIPLKNYIPAINSQLPSDIRVMSVQEKDEDFNARFSATARTYRYFMHCSQTVSAKDMRFVWPLFRYPNVDRLNEMASVLKGEIDCTTFSAVGDKSLSKSRYLKNAFFYMDGDILVFEITANAFLWRMVRSLTGSLLFFEKKNYDAAYFKSVLEAKDRSLAGPTAPPQGLFLWDINFDGKRIHP